MDNTENCGRSQDLTAGQMLMELCVGLELHTAEVITILCVTVENVGVFTQRLKVIFSWRLCEVPPVLI